MKLRSALAAWFGLLMSGVGTTFSASHDATESAPRPVVHVTHRAPIHFEKRGDIYFADFGAAVYGNVQITFPQTIAPGTVVSVRLGEKLDPDGRIDRAPGGSIAYRSLSFGTGTNGRLYSPMIPLQAGPQSHPDAIQAPARIGNIMPFRYAEIEGSPSPLTAASVRQLFVHSTFDDQASAFASSDDTLNAVWNLCKHTMKATTAFGVYIDGDRERKPYEADAYINFLSHLACDANLEMGRYSLEYLLAHPTWPTEWSFHMPMMAVAEYQAGGDLALARRNYEALKAKLLIDRAGPDGLIHAKAICDWPTGERDGFDGDLMVNTPVNAFYFHALNQMELLARALGKEEEAHRFEELATQVSKVFNEKFFDPGRGLYVDGEGSSHASLHANMFALAFGLVPPGQASKVADFVESRGMACSVYGAQYLLEALYATGKEQQALKLLTSRDERSWWNMLQVGSTMTLEAWDLRFKKNLTWNHAWGAAPANIISRYLVGVRPLEPGYRKILIAPRPANLNWFKAKVPTVRGPVRVQWERKAGWSLKIDVPRGTTATVSLPRESGAGEGPFKVLVDGKETVPEMNPGEWRIEPIRAGVHTIEMVQSNGF